ncbi:isopenicillin N synthase family dioxygenase [Vibrio sp. MA40-2]|uniref:isopenicillin N synthase family dioxygenase n=1 Tax=Vibrio sp. MA40-2 TaxID=3391828 RepID=UPI0039A50140
MNYALDELNFETTIGDFGGIDNDREIPVIDLSDFDHRREEIKEALWDAATKVGFFQLSNHSIPISLIQNAFAQSAQFFAQKMEIKQSVSLLEGENAGWEYKSQVRPSTGTPDEKESYQITLPKMVGLWPDQELLPIFQPVLLHMEQQAWNLGMDILSCFAEKLGMDSDFFKSAHDRQSQQYQSTLRLIHYLPITTDQPLAEGIWRAGAHTDFDCLTMVFQKNGEGGLQVCPGKDTSSNIASSNSINAWTDVEPRIDLITCNIGDMLMRWSDDKLRSTLHRVRMPNETEGNKARYSMAFFCQANKDQLIQGPLKKYQAITASDYMKQRIQANFKE